jgi:hypothetical protein
MSALAPALIEGVGVALIFLVLFHGSIESARREQLRRGK